MAQNKKTLLLLTVLAFCTVTIASPLVKRDTSSSEESDESGEVVSGLQKMCRENRTVIAKLMESVQDAIFCFNDAIDFESFIGDVDNSTNEIKPFTGYCPELKIAYTCFKIMFDDFRPCLEEDFLTIAQALAGILPNALDLMCKIDGEIFSKFDQPQSYAFIDNIADGVNECANTFLNGTNVWDLPYLNQDQCSNLSSLRKCLQATFNNCKAPDLINVYDMFHNTLFRVTPCRNYEERQTFRDISKESVGNVDEANNDLGV